MEKPLFNIKLDSSQSIAINSNPEMIWEALTNPTFISQYLFGAQTITDWKVGSDILFKIVLKNATSHCCGQSECC